MSYVIDGSTIYLTRGDSFSAVLTLRQGEQEYTPAEGDVIRFAMKSPKMTSGGKEFVDEEPLILKFIDHGTMSLDIEPEDTKSLPFGDYVYDIEITFEDGTVDTFITESPFVITPEVH